MKKTLFIYSNFDFTNSSAGRTRMLCYAKGLAKQGVEVILVSCSTSPLSMDCFEEWEPGILIHTTKTRTKGFFKTIQFIRRLYRFSKEYNRPNSFLFYPSPLVFLEVISLFYLKGFKSQRVFYELNEIRKYSSTFQLNYSWKRPFYSIKKILFSTTFSLLELLLKYYTGLICISTAIENYGRKYNDNTVRVPILTQPGNIMKSSGFKIVQPDRFNLGFSGSIKPSKENLENFLEVLSRLKLKGYQIQFNLCGPVSKDYGSILFEETAKRLGIDDNISYHGNLNSEELSAFLTQQDLLVIPRGYTRQNHFGFSTKLSDYLNHNKVVLVTDISDNSLYIRDGFNGFIVPPDNNDLMFEKLKYIIDNFKNLKESISENARKTSIKHFSYDNYGKTLEQFLFPGT